MKMKLTPLKAVLLGGILAGCVMVGIGAGLTKFVGQFYGNGAGLTNVVGSTTISGVTITNGVFQWPLDGVNEDALVKHDTHGIDLDYRKIDGSGSTALFRTVDGAFHFTTPPYIDGANFLGNALGIDPTTGAVIPIDGTVPVNNFFVTNLFVTNVTAQTINVSGKATFNQITVTNSLNWYTNRFNGPSNSIDLNVSMQTYITFTPFSFTGVVNKLSYAGQPISIGISNAASTNVTGYYPYFLSSDGTRSAIVTNGTVGRFWLLYDPSLIHTDIVARPTFF